MLQVATMVKEGVCVNLREAFEIVSPQVLYTAERAKRKLLQMPLACIRVGRPSDGNSYAILTESFKDERVGVLVNTLVQAEKRRSPAQNKLDKGCVRMLLSLAQSDRERECLRYAVVQASGISATEARRRYGFENMSTRLANVEEAICKVKEIREAVDALAEVQDKAVLAGFGIVDSDSSDESDSEDELDSQECQMLNHKSCLDKSSVQDQQGHIVELSQDVLKEKLQQSCFNWFEFWEQYEHLLGLDQDSLDLCMMKQVFGKISELGLSTEDLGLVNQSYDAFLAAESDQMKARQTARAVNGEVVSESESDDPDSYLSTTDILSDEGKKLVAKRRMCVKRKARRLKATAIATANLLSRRKSKRCSIILRDHPDIGKTIETFVENGNVGADHWRRTGVLTFDGNARLEHKITYERIRKHLEQVYNRHFSYGTVVQLCVARNRRRSSAKRYRGVAHVTTRRARKGFNLRYNPDSHWSAALYKGLNEIQLKDGQNMVVLNRDDAAGFRLDTLATSKQYATPSVQGHDVLTTRTDYVNKYPSTLQTTSYNFPSTETTVELCGGIVKAYSLFSKNPAQHAADLEMLKKNHFFLPAFNNKDGVPKPIDCIRVDGASDEGPGHEEVQYWWTRRHILEGKIVTLVTTRSSGSSYLNRVELQNGCLSRSHSNTFIPSTLTGSNFDQSGAVNKDKLHENLHLAIDAYISRCDGCACGRTCIHLMKGSDSTEFQAVRNSLLVFLKGTKKRKESLKQNNPDLYIELQKIWDIRNRHMVKGLPTQYIFMLLCCFEATCPHPMCQAGRPADLPTWYPGGPSVTHLPLPVPDPERPWGSTSCITCKGFCSGHFKAPTYVDVTNKEAVQAVAQPPSSVLKQLLSGNAASADIDIDSASECVLLSPGETQIWVEHLRTVNENIRRGAEKAAATRRAKKAARSRNVTCTEKAPDEQPQASPDKQAQASPDKQAQASPDEYICGVCNVTYEEETIEEELWIACDVCDVWYHTSCEGLSELPSSDTYTCSKCQL